MKSLILLLSFLSALATAQEVNPANNYLPKPPEESATSVTIGWVLSTATNVVSQTVSWGLSPTNYTFFVNVTPGTSAYQIKNLQPSTTYYIAVYCTQATGATSTNLVRSFYSNEIVHTTYPTERPASPTGTKVISVP